LKPTAYFMSNNKKVNKIIKHLELTKNLFVTSLVVGEAYIGKLDIVRNVYDKLMCVDGADDNEVCRMLKKHNKLIITNFDKLINDNKIDFEKSGFCDCQIIAIANYASIDTTPNYIKNYFAFIYEVPPLKERSDDIKKFQTQLQNKITKKINNAKKYNSYNLNSAKLDAYKQIIFKNLSENDLKELLTYYFDNNLNENKTYKEYIQFYEEILLQVGLNKFGSKMKLAKALNITRNTIRAKISNEGI